MSIRYDEIVIDGISYAGILPSVFEPDYENYGVRASSSKSLGGGRTVLVHARGKDSDTDTKQHRKIKIHGWKVGFGEGSPAPLVLADHLDALYTIQKNFWIQFDNEMSRCLVPLESIGENSRAFFTPTSPIFPEGHEPGDALDFSGALFLNGVLFDRPFTVDHENGMVVIGNSILLPDTARLQISYTWRAFVKIVECYIEPVGQVAQDQYRVELLLEQLPLPELTTMFMSAYVNTCAEADRVNRAVGSIVFGGSVEATAPMTGQNSARGSITFPDVIGGIKATVSTPGGVVRSAAVGSIEFGGDVTGIKIPAPDDTNRSARGEITFGGSVTGMIKPAASALGTIVFDGVVTARKVTVGEEGGAAAGDIVFDGGIIEGRIVVHGAASGDIVFSGPSITGTSTSQQQE